MKKKQRKQDARDYVTDGSRAFSRMQRKAAPVAGPKQREPKHAGHSFILKIKVRFRVEAITIGTVAIAPLILALLHR